VKWVRSRFKTADFACERALPTRFTVAVDGSPASEAGVRCALSLAGDDTTLFFCRVVDPASAVRDIPFKAPLSPAELHAAARAACEDGVREANARGGSVKNINRMPSSWDLTVARESPERSSAAPPKRSFASATSGCRGPRGRHVACGTDRGRYRCF
jgi:hypothetical protein